MKELFMVLKPNLVDSRTNTITLISSDGGSRPSAGWGCSG